MTNPSLSPNLTLLDIVKDHAIGPIRWGIDISDIGELLGPPDFWAFYQNDECFVCRMEFGDVEVGFKAINNLVRVEYAKFYLSKFVQRSLKFVRLKRKSRRYIRNDFSALHPRFSTTVRLLSKNNISFTQRIVSFVPEEKWIVMQFDKHLRFYFTYAIKVENSRLSFVEIGPAAR